MTVKEYKINNDWAILIYILTPVIVFFLLALPFISNDTLFQKFYVLYPLLLGILGLLIFGILEVVNTKVIITSDTISYRSTFVNRDLKFSEIKGYRVEDKHILVFPNSRMKKTIKITKYIDHSDELIAWLASRFPDLDQVLKEKELNEILKNLEYGNNPDESLRQLHRAQKLAKILNWTGGLLSVWTFFKPQPYGLAIWASVLFPLITIFIVVYYKGLIRIDEKNGSPYPTVFIAIVFPALGLSLRALYDYHLFDYSNIWPPVISIAIVLTIIVLSKSRGLQFRNAIDYFTFLMYVFFFMAYAYGTVVSLNCMYDKSAPEIYRTKVIGKRISSGKMKSCNLKLEPWGPQTGSNEVSVPISLYRNVEINDTVNIYLKKGRFEIPWLYVARKKGE